MKGSNNIFSTLLLIARPAAGKSEIIAFLNKISDQTREESFHMGKIVEIDDFPMLWTWFEEDHLLEHMGKPRLHTDEEGYFKETYLWDLLVERISLEYQKLLREQPDLHDDSTAIIEFSRGEEHGGFRRAFRHLSPDILEDLAVIYIDVSWEESLRKNRKRFNPDRPGSILEHSLPEEKMRRLYRENDWDNIEKSEGKFLNIQGHKIPFAVFKNENDYTSKDDRILGRELEKVISKLWAIGQTSKKENKLASLDGAG